MGSVKANNREPHWEMNDNNTSYDLIFVITCSELTDQLCSVEITVKWTLACSMEYQGLSFAGVGIGK